MIALALLALVTASDVRRVAVVVGANLAPEGRQRLRFAHDDADHIADALTRVGRFKKDDVHLLKDPSPVALLEALDAAADAATPGEQKETMFLFYYSGHADVTALYPHGQRLPLAQVKRRLERSNATVRVGLLDAADSSGDGSVTLNEAYRYAQSVAVRDSALMAAQPQHPSFEMYLAGRDDLTLSETRDAPSSFVARTNHWADRSDPLEQRRGDAGASRRRAFCKSSAATWPLLCVNDDSTASGRNLQCHVGVCTQNDECPSGQTCVAENGLMFCR